MDTNYETYEEILEMPVLALRNVVAMPQTSIFIEAARKASISAVNLAIQKFKYIFLVAQRDPSVEDPKESDLYTVGVIAKVVNILKTGSSEIRVSFRGVSKAKLSSMRPRVKGSLMADVVPISEAECPVSSSAEVQAAVRVALNSFSSYASASDSVPRNIFSQIAAITDAVRLSYTLTQYASLYFKEKQRILETQDVVERLAVLAQALDSELEIIGIENSIANKVKDRIDKNQRDFYLREQIRAIQEELGDDEYDDLSDDMAELLSKIHASAMPEQNRELLLREFQRMIKLPPGTQEAALIRTYIETCLELPWGVRTEDKTDISRAAKVLDSEHYGLEKIKERILETLAVRQFNSQVKGQIICLVGPPGTGKTSIAESVAKALDRRFVRISLGGVHDESEIRGHRRTYIGAMPGKIMAAVREAKSSNPLLLLDEIDKLGRDYRGDPAAALLEVLDPEQNKSFKDHFIDMEFDLSDVFFITTANVTDTIPAPLLDRMEVIELNSYTSAEKIQIAKRHLVPKQLKKHGMKAANLKISASAINDIILYYTREAGVRNLERSIAALCRKAAKQLIETPELGCVRINGKNLNEYLGVRKYIPEHIPDTDTVGVVTGLAYTSVGGEIMPLEVNVMEGTGKIELTGSLGDVMKESAKAAISYVRANALSLDIDPFFYKDKDIHIHVPEGAVPKDGPSAGCAMATALYSQLSGRRVRRDVAMTGEITIRGRVLAIGGLKEKTMAAYKAGVSTVIVPAENAPDIEELPEIVRQSLTFVTARTAAEVFDNAFIPQDRPNLCSAAD